LIANIFKWIRIKQPYRALLLFSMMQGSCIFMRKLNNFIIT